MSANILRLPGVRAQTGYSRSTIYARVAQGLFTKPVTLGVRCVGWPAREVEAINAAHIAGRAEDEIRSLVQSLHQQRQHLVGSILVPSSSAVPFGQPSSVQLVGG